MPNYFRDFFQSATVVAGATATLWRKRWVSKPGVGYALGVGVQDPNNWATTTFRFKVNDVPVVDYGDIKDRIGSPDLMTPVKIDIPANAVIECEVTNGGAADDLFFGRLQCRTIE